MKKFFKKIISALGYKIKRTDQKIGPNNIWDGKLPVKNRFEPFAITFMGHTLHVHDKSTFQLVYNELFDGDIYRFKTDTKEPYIIDCGANLGMSVIYFKNLYPHAKIIAFEADEHIFSFLKKNIDSFGLTNIELVNKAVWDTDNKMLTFFAEGGAGGRVEEKATGPGFTNVETTRLRKYLTTHVDFLKLDIEGAETKVIIDCAEVLKNVQTLFVEYHSFADSEQQLDTLLKIVKDAGFKYQIKEAYTNHKPFMERRLNGGMDLQLNIFCYRV